MLAIFDENDNILTESAIGNRILFQGREYDWDTGFYYFRARYYDPDTCRWLSKDPIGINGGLNQYVFCGNNPVMFVDFDGLRIRENVIDTRIVNGIPQVLVQTLEWKWYYLNGMNDSKPVGDPVWRNARGKTEQGYFVYGDDDCPKRSGYVYPHAALGQETKGMEHAANQMYVSGIAGAGAVGTSPYWVPPTLSFGVAMFYTGGAFYLSNAAEINTGLLYGIPSAQTSYIAGISAGAEFLIEKILDDIL